MKELVTVIVPILDPNLNPVQERLLHHCLEVLTKYPIIFITYSNADLSIIREHRENIDVIYFPKEYFESRQSLARLLLMEDFYDQFSWSGYLLIHELNSWVVKDELYYWCKQGYDYLKAAPVISRKDSGLTNPFARISGLDNSQKQELGNGFKDNGIYLCLVERMVNTLKNKQKVAYQYRHQIEFTPSDAIFWEIEANRFWTNLRKPSGIVQNFFAQHIDQMNNLKIITKEKLPFAVTGINTTNIDFLPLFSGV